MKCRKAMWWGDGGPAGHCDKPAYGRTRYDWRGSPLDWACELHGGPSLDVNMDGNKWCASVHPYQICGTGEDGRRAPKPAGFVNLAQSPAGFGDTKEEAVADLAKQLLAEARR